MTNSRRTRPAADVAVGYAAGERGNAIAYAAINSGSGTAIVRLAFSALPLKGLDGLEVGYAAMAAVGAHLKARGFVRVRVRLADARVVADLNGGGAPPKALGMAYVRARCALHGLGAVRLELSDAVDVRDLGARAQAEMRLSVAA